MGTLLLIRVSSNGRTERFGRSNGGPNPSTLVFNIFLKIILTFVNKFDIKLIHGEINDTIIFLLVKPIKYKIISY